MLPMTLLLILLVRFPASTLSCADVNVANSVSRPEEHTVELFVPASISYRAMFHDRTLLARYHQDTTHRAKTIGYRNRVYNGEDEWRT
jgi:hypothetical protein